MYKVDLLKGEGVPIRSRPGGIAFACLVIVVPMIVGSAIASIYLEQRVATSVQLQQLNRLRTAVTASSEALETKRSLQEQQTLGVQLLGDVKTALTGRTQWPVVDRREADTKLLVKNGQTVVLGGLRKKEVTKQLNKIPLLGDLPVVGNVFRFKGENTVNSELLVFITPWIIEQPALSETETESFQETELPPIEPVYTEAELGKR